MGVYERNDSPYWWLWLEQTKQREKTNIKVGATTAQRRESRRIALDRYHQRMNELAARLYKLPSAQPAIRFAKYAEPYTTDTIAHRKGARRERELLAQLRRFFGDDLLTAIDRDRVRAYHTFRKADTPPAAAVTINREVDLLKGMLRDAVPKYLPASPLLGMPRLETVAPRRRYTSEEEFARLLAVCEDAEDTAILLIGRDALVRLGDVLDLQHTDRTGSLLYVRDPKGGTPYETALSPRALAAVEAIDATASRYLFPKFRRALNERDWPGSVRQRLEYLCKKAGLPYGRTAHGVTFHWGTRRSGATDLLMKRGKKLPAVQRLGNWKKPDVLLEIYTEVTTADLLEAVDAVPAKKRKRA
jgi:integrase